MVPSLLLVLAIAPAADPAPSLDDLILKLKAARQAAADQAKAVAAIEQEIKDRFAQLQKALAELGLAGPVPPDPAPPPKPVDPLLVKLRDAYATDGKNRVAALQLAALYEEAAKLAKDPMVASTSALLEQVRKAGASLTADTMKAVRTVVAAELAAVLGNPSDAALTQAQRDAAAALFAKLAVILEGF